MSGDEFFRSPEQQSVIKTKIVAKYFGAWVNIMLPRLTRPSDRIAYLDLFCGPGRFADGRQSTPLWILNHAIHDPRLRERLITKFSDANQTYVEQLKAAISGLPSVNLLANPPEVAQYTVGRELVTALQTTRLIPTLFFIDPWGYKGLTLDLIAGATRSWGCDCIFFFNYNRIGPGITNPVVVEHMDELFGKARADELRTRLIGCSSRERQTLVMSDMIEALRHAAGRYVLPFEFKSIHGERTSHYLFFVSKSFRGYDIMKDVMWGLSSNSGAVREFAYLPSRNNQLSLFDELDQSLNSEVLKQKQLSDCKGRSLTVEEVTEITTVDTPYTSKNAKEALKALEREGLVWVDPPASKRRANTLADRCIVRFPT